MATSSRSPSANDIAAAITALSAPANARASSDGVTKAVVGGICAMLGAIILALIFWVGSSVTDLSTSVTKMSANVDNLQKSIADLQQGQGASTKTIGDLQANVAAGSARMTAIEQDVSRTKERVRILEGMKPVG